MTISDKLYFILDLSLFIELSIDSLVGSPFVCLHDLFEDSDSDLLPD